MFGGRFERLRMELNESVPYVLLFILYDIAMRHLDSLRMGLHTIPPDKLPNPLSLEREIRVQVFGQGLVVDACAFTNLKIFDS
jgi:hypothetical protein